MSARRQLLMCRLLRLPRRQSLVLRHRRCSRLRSRVMPRRGRLALTILVLARARHLPRQGVGGRSRSPRRMADRAGRGHRRWCCRQSRFMMALLRRHHRRRSTHAELQLMTMDICRASWTSAEHLRLRRHQAELLSLQVTAIGSAARRLTSLLPRWATPATPTGRAGPPGALHPLPPRPLLLRATVSVRKRRSRRRKSRRKGR